MLSQPRLAHNLTKNWMMRRQAVGSKRSMYARSMNIIVESKFKPILVELYNFSRFFYWTKIKHALQTLGDIQTDKPRIKNISSTILILRRDALCKNNYPQLAVPSFMPPCSGGPYGVRISKWNKTIFQDHRVWFWYCWFKNKPLSPIIHNKQL